jgi:hypothetical protein
VPDGRLHACNHSTAPWCTAPTAVLHHAACAWRCCRGSDLTQDLSCRVRPPPAASGTQCRGVRRNCCWARTTPQHLRSTACHSLRLSVTVTPKFFPLYYFSPLFSPLFFHLPQRFPLNTPPIPHYHYKISFSIPTINFLSTNNYSWTHSTVFRVMNSDTLDLGGERRRPTRRGRCRGTAAAIRCPLQPSWKGRGSGRVDRCGQS